MGYPRSVYVREGEEGVYHCFSRCVRRAFLFGSDPVTGRDYSHRKAWVVERLQFLSSIFAIDVCEYSVLPTHYHNILRTRPDLAALWTDREVARRWLTLCPRRHKKQPPVLPPSEEEITALCDQPERIAVLRKRLSSVSWFMGRLNEWIARKANQEDQVTGRFWESRFKCRPLLDDPAIVACMVYVALNLIRAGLADTPEDSDYTGIQERIRAWGQTHRMSLLATNPEPAIGLASTCETLPAAAAIPDVRPETVSALPAAQDSWLCPIQSEPGRRGILAMTLEEYFELVDRSGRLIRSDKPGAIDPGLAPILLRIGANADAWRDTVTHFESRFRLAAGIVSSLQGLAARLGRGWLQGVTMARSAFYSSPPESA
jgi:hypothetical protein